MSDKKIVESSDKKAVSSAQNSTLTSQNNHDKKTHSVTKKNNTQKKRSFSDRWENNRFWLIRASYKILRTIWMIVMGIGVFIAWLISMLFI